MHRLVITLFLIIISTICASAQSLPVPSYWKNERGSEMKLYAMAADGTFKGIFISHTAGFPCQNTPYDLWGRAIGNHVRFWVVFKNWATDCKAAAVWRGHVVGPAIWTWGLLIVHHNNGTVSKIAGPDIFHQQP